ncbi:LamG domain-containing protein [Blastopirellula sp. J2-11]|uniref:LamG domain-containing protein n=1 Tax=Blastopirellula sp. J2-11 TaxID=2943192 RepID=UPI0021C83664|nr:LamG domain-containing protein [Blastopirellula sp. J2-11]UUO05066.1 LamG domain-containing protein [Blastopirellula sp. J2-11]
MRKDRTADASSELIQLLGEYANGVISPARLVRLEAILNESPDARKDYIHYFRLHAGLYDLVDELSQRDQQHESTALVAAENRKFEYRVYWLPGAIAFLAACILIACFALLPFGRDSADPAQAMAKSSSTSVNRRPGSFDLPAFTTSQPIAIISRMADVVMAPGQESLHIGQGLSSQQLSVKSGLLQLDFLNGVTVVVEGTVELELVSQTRCKLLCGQARVYADSLEDGFALETDEATFIDRGTEFGVRVVPGKQAEVHVFDGQVDVLPRNGDPATRSVTTGRAMSISSQLQPQDILVRPDEFPSIRGMNERLSDLTSERYAKWRQDRQQILADEDLLVFYDFQTDPDNAQQVVNLATDGLNGNIVGCNVAQGRWPGKQSLEFKKFHDRVRINVPGEFDSITLSVWIRIDGFDREFNSIMLTDYFQDGHIHWQFRSSGMVDLGIRPKDERRILYLSDSVLGYEDLGRWVQLVAVVDRDLGKVFHYLDGKLIMQAPIETGKERDYRAPSETLAKLRIGQAELGNWRRKDPGEPYSIRSLNGRMDEFSLYSRALNEAEVARLYEIGRP